MAVAAIPPDANLNASQENALIHLIKTIIAVSGTFLISACLLSACDGRRHNSPDDTPASSVMQIGIPERIRTSTAVNLQATRATLVTSAGAVSMTRIGNQFEGSIDVATGTSLSFELVIYEQVGNQRIVYARYQGSSNGPLTTDRTIPVFENNYTYPDDDADGASNLEERNAGSNPSDYSSTPENSAGTTAGQIRFVESSSQVEEGEEVQIQIQRTGGSNGSVTALVESSAFTGITITPQQLVWAAGDTRVQSITVRPDSNIIPGDSQTIQLRLTTPTGGATLGTAEMSLTILDITIISPPPFTASETDGEWEVCFQPYNTSGPSPFATQLSANEGRIVNCFKPCTDNVIVDPVNAGIAWMAFAQHSCFLSDASPGTYANAPVYTPRREQMELNLRSDTLINSETIWACDTQNRANIDYEYRVTRPALSWYQFNDDGTYYHAITTDGAPPPRLLGPETWSTVGRTLELSHIDTGYRNIVFFPGDQTFHIHPDTDNRIRCTKQSY